MDSEKKMLLVKYYQEKDKTVMDITFVNLFITLPVDTEKPRHTGNMSFYLFILL